MAPAGDHSPVIRLHERPHEGADAIAEVGGVAVALSVDDAILAVTRVRGGHGTEALELGIVDPAQLEGHSRHRRGQGIPEIALEHHELGPVVGAPGHAGGEAIEALGPPRGRHLRQQRASLAHAHNRLSVSRTISQMRATSVRGTDGSQGSSTSEPQRRSVSGRAPGFASSGSALRWSGI